jgi:pimeloyl-ACP methyl ester carboxylesterase
MGGGVSLQYLLDYPGMVASLTLVSTVSPYGFSGTRGADGEPCFRDYSGSGAGVVNPEFIAQMKAQNRESGESPVLPRNVLNFTYWKPPFRASREEDFLTSLLQTAVGDYNYPGDWVPSPNWPGFAPGPNGVLNAFSPKYFNAGGIVNLDSKPPILWIRGADDQLVSDSSLWDIAYLGKLGLAPGWPGDDVYPPQPMLAQTRAVLDQYRLKGGSYREVVLASCGHSPHVEKTDEFVKVLTQHIDATRQKTHQ